MNGNLYELLRSHFSGALDRTFITIPGGASVTYHDVDERSARMATVLREQGVGAGDRIAVQVPKSVDAVALYLASLRAGAIYVPLNPNYVAAEVEYLLTDCQPALFVRDQHDDQSGDEAGAAATMSMSSLASDADAAAPTPKIEIRLADDIAAVLYTSGTTGRPKGAMLTHGNLASNALTLHRLWRFDAADVLLHILPIFHVHGLFVALHTTMLNATPTIFLTRFDVDSVLAALPDATVMMGVPTHYARLLEDPRFTSDRCANVRTFISGSAPMTELLHGAVAERTGHRVLERYGMTETGMITSNPFDGERLAGTVGFALPGVDVRIVDESGEPCNGSTAGVVEVRGPNVFAGYWRLPERTDAEHHDGWFITGDIGSLDPEGRLTLEGRAGDMIISGGLNVYPKEVETVIDEVDCVVESAVIGVPNEDLGEAVVAIVVTWGDSRTALVDISAAVEQRLANFKRPKEFHLVDELPRNTMGKIQKAKLRELLESQQ